MRIERVSVRTLEGLVREIIEYNRELENASSVRLINQGAVISATSLISSDIFCHSGSRCTSTKFHKSHIYIPRCQFFFFFLHFDLLGFTFITNSK